MSNVAEQDQAPTGFARRPSHAREWTLSLLVALQILGIFVILPLGPRLHLPPLLSAGVTTAIALLVFTLVHRARWAVILLFTAAFAEAAAIVLRVLHPSNAAYELDFVASSIFTVASSTLLGGVVFGPGRVTPHRIAGAVAIYLNVGFVFGLAYRLDALFVPGAFKGAFDNGSPQLLSFIYYSYATLTTSAYGDILPVDPFARSIANLEAIAGQLFPATLLARLVMLELEARRE